MIKSTTHTRVNIHNFLMKYLTSVTEELRDNLTKAEMQGFDYAHISNEAIEEVKAKRAEYLKKEKAMFKCVALNNKGMDYEKEGKINLAIKTYEKNIDSNFPAHHSFKRLMILYRKEKKYDDELRVIFRALEVFPDSQEYQDQLTKVEQLLEKQK